MPTTFFSNVGVTYINTESLDRLAREHMTSGRAVCAAVSPAERNTRSGKSAHAIADPTPDYVALTMGELQQRADQAGAGIRPVLQRILAEARGLGLDCVIFPKHPRLGMVGGPGDSCALPVPAFIRAAHSVSPLDSPPPSAAALLDETMVLRQIEEAKKWMQPHVPGLEMALAKASRALGIGPIAKALSGDDDTRHCAFRMFMGGTCLVLAMRTHSRIGGSDPQQQVVLCIAIMRLIVERAFAEPPKYVHERIGQVVHDFAFGRSHPKRYAAQGNFFHALEQVVPPNQGELSCPTDETIEAAVAASLQIGLEQARHARERADLGLHDPHAVDDDR